MGTIDPFAPPTLMVNMAKDQQNTLDAAAAAAAAAAVEILPPQLMEVSSSQVFYKALIHSHHDFLL